MKRLKTILLYAFFALIGYNLYCQDEPITIEAEEGTLGSDYWVDEYDGATYVEPLTDYAGLSNPATDDKVITYEVTFTEHGTYQLFVRLMVGRDDGDDDSFFFGNGFGTKSSTADSDWIMVNQIGYIGYSEPEDIVYENGNAPNVIWKWINLTVYTGNTFEVDSTDSTLVFQIGARENGLKIDKFAFGKTGVYYTVANLDNGEAGSTTPPVAPEPVTGDPLAYGKCKYLGCCYGQSSSQDFEHYWNQVVPENAGKWGSVEGTRDVMNWTELDNAYNLAKDNGFPFRWHVLVWGSQQPGWIESLTESEQLEEIKEWFAAIAERYDDIDIIEVVNEPMHAQPSYKNALGGDGSSGWDWIIEAFKLAKQYFPGTSLMINEYGIASNPSTARDYVEIIELLQAENLIDAIGLQAHGFSLTGTAEKISESLDILAETELPIIATEMDIDGPTDEEQLASYETIFPLFWEHESVEGISLWGFRIGMWRTDAGANLLNANGTDRPAMTWLRDYVATNTAGGNCPVSVNMNLLNNDVSIFPNPSNGYIQVQCDGFSSIEIYNINGQKVLESVEKTICIHSISKGVYFIKIINRKGESYLRKLIY
ncbi:endo-1,4-beta-xylanase [Bacteroidota bacterium]